MNLAFNFEDKLFWIHNFLPKETYKKMYVEFIKNRNKLHFKKSSVNWRTFKEEVDNMSESYDQQNQEDNLQEYLDTYHSTLKNQPFVNFTSLELKSHLRIFKYNQHLAWHSDEKDNREYAATFYFNKTWNDNWGA
jgi:Rps23 Pro-64 3,4-dihydroxylase Tpa1-like proline 4-hydroxylase